MLQQMIQTIQMQVLISFNAHNVFIFLIFFTFITFNWLKCIYCSCIKTTLLFAVDYLPDEGRADNTDDENSACEEVDYDKIFDDNLLKQAYEYKERRDSSAVENHTSEDEDVDEESRVSSSQEISSRAITRKLNRPVDEQETLSDFDGEIVFRKDLNSLSAKESHLQDMEDNKKSMAKRSKRDLKSLPDDESPSEKERKLGETFFKFIQAFQSNLQV